MSLHNRYVGHLRTLAHLLTATLPLVLASCSQIQTQSTTDAIGPARPISTATPEVKDLPGATEPPDALATQPLNEQTGVEMPISPFAPASAAATQPLYIGVSDAVLLSLENNQGLIVQRFNPRIERTFVAAERARFDPVLSGSLTSSHGKSRSPTTQPHKTSAGLSRGLSARLGIDELLPWGTQLRAEAGTGVSYPGTDAFDEYFTSRIGVNITQPLLRGFGLDVNLAALRQAGIDVTISQYQLRAFAESLIALVQETYWDYALAQQQIAIVMQSRGLARQQLDETSERIRIGKLAETELAAAQAQVALREGNLIDARSTLARTRLNLIRLLNPNGPDMWDRDIILQTQPSVPEVDLGSVEEHVAVAMRMRPDLNQARLQLQKNELTIVRTKNGLLPQLDLFVDAGRSGYADSFDGSLHGKDGLGYDVQFGGLFQYPPINRAARAAYTASVLNRSQQIEAIRNLEQIVQVEVRTAFIEVNRTREQVTATAATRRLQEETLRAETEKFRVGKSTSLLVAAAQRDLLVAQISEVQAVVSYLKSLIELYRIEGTLLVRGGIDAPGFAPIPSVLR